MRFIDIPRVVCSLPLHWTSLSLYCWQVFSNFTFDLRCRIRRRLKTWRRKADLSTASGTLALQATSSRYLDRTRCCGHFQPTGPQVSLLEMVFTGRPCKILTSASTTRTTWISPSRRPWTERPRYRNRCTRWASRGTRQTLLVKYQHRTRTWSLGATPEKFRAVRVQATVK